MTKAINKYFLLLTLVLFLFGLGLTISLRRQPVYVNKVSEGGSVLGEQIQTSLNPLDLYFNSDFLSVENSLPRYRLKTESYQELVKIFPKVYPPQNIEVRDSRDGRMVTIRWDEFQTPPERIKILRADAVGEEPKVIGEVAGTALGYHDLDIEQGKEYYYTLVSIALNNTESNSIGPYKVGPIKDMFVPDPPSKAQVIYKDVQIIITWLDPNDDDLKLINIYRSLKSGELGEKKAEVLPGVQNYTDNDIEEGATYYYTLVSEDLSGNQSQYHLIGSELGNPNPFVPSFSL